DLFQRAKQGLVLGEVFLSEPRIVGPPVVRTDGLSPGQGAGEKATAQGAEGDKGDPQLPAGGDNRRFWLSRPEGVFRLQGGEGVDLVSSPEGLCGDLREPQGADLAGLDEFGQGTDRVLDRAAGLGTMQVVKVNDVGTQ